MSHVVLPVPRGPNKKKLLSDAKICLDFASMPQEYGGEKERCQTFSIADGKYWLFFTAQMENIGI